jgi:hypothetical protein
MKEKANRGADETASAGSPEPELDHKPTPRKRAKKVQPVSTDQAAAPIKRVQGKQGKLKGLMNMPIDVFTEVSLLLFSNCPFSTLTFCMCRLRYICIHSTLSYWHERTSSFASCS